MDLSNVQHTFKCTYCSDYFKCYHVNKLETEIVYDYYDSDQCNHWCSTKRCVCIECDRKYDVVSMKNRTCTTVKLTEKELVAFRL